MRKIERLFHLAEADNLPSILEHGLLSTEQLLELTGMAASDRVPFLERHRLDGVRLSPSVAVRDQRPMPPSALAGALDDGMTPAEWYALLNSFVFLWPDHQRLERQRRACGARPQVVLVFDTEAVLDHVGDDALVSPINTGNARRKPARRSRQTFVPYRDWQRDGWPTGNRARPPAELVIRGMLPARAPFLFEMIEM
jgi:hypothetical protein